MRATQLMEGEEQRQMEGDNTTPRTAAYEESMGQIKPLLTWCNFSNLYHPTPLVTCVLPWKL